ncbi:unnamed protein product, partial [Trichogramma brassicae]
MKYVYPFFSINVTVSLCVLTAPRSTSYLRELVTRARRRARHLSSSPPKVPIRQTAREYRDTSVAATVSPSTPVLSLQSFLLCWLLTPAFVRCGSMNSDAVTDDSCISGILATLGGSRTIVLASCSRFFMWLLYSIDCSKRRLSWKPEDNLTNRNASWRNFNQRCIGDLVHQVDGTQSSTFYSPFTTPRKKRSWRSFNQRCIGDLVKQNRASHLVCSRCVARFGQSRICRTVAARRFHRFCRRIRSIISNKPNYVKSSLCILDDFSNKLKDHILVMRMLIHEFHHQLISSTKDNVHAAIGTINIIGVINIKDLSNWPIDYCVNHTNGFHIFVFFHYIRKGRSKLKVSGVGSSRFKVAATKTADCSRKFLWRPTICE